MTVRSQWWIVGAIVAALGIGLYAVVQLAGDELFPVGPGRAAPEWTARSLIDSTVVKTGASYAGDVVLLNVWATWCQPCRVEMPSLAALQSTFPVTTGFHVVAVSIDDPGKQDDILAFGREYQLNFELLHDPSKRIKKTFQTTGVPETFIIGADGIVRRKMIGAEDWNSQGNRALITQLLRERAQQRRGGTAEPSARVTVPVKS